MKKIISSCFIFVISFAAFGENQSCSLLVDEQLAKIKRGVHSVADESHKKLALSHEAASVVKSCVKSDNELSLEARSRVLGLVLKKYEKIDMEYERFYRLESSDIDEIQRDAYMDDSRTYVINSTMDLLVKVKSFYEHEKKRLNVENRKRASGKSFKNRENSTDSTKRWIVNEAIPE